MADEHKAVKRAETQRPRFLLAALATPFIIIGAAVVLARQFERRPGHGYTGVSILLVAETAAVLFATIFLIWGWRDGERPRWVGVLGVAISVYLLKKLLIG